MSMLSRVSWLRWGELGLGGLLGLELLEGVECLVESESGWMRHNGVGEGLTWWPTKDGRVCVKMCVFKLPLRPGPDPNLRHCAVKLLPQNLNK